jgi:hypothetical protein
MKELRLGVCDLGAWGRYEVVVRANPNVASENEFCLRYIRVIHKYLMAHGLERDAARFAEMLNAFEELKVKVRALVELGCLDDPLPVYRGLGDQLLRQHSCGAG